jgi:phosphoinositide-3-kinase regulatory subunit 4
MLVGTSYGFVALWDLRFQIIVSLWRHSYKSPIISLQTVPNSYCEVEEPSLSSLPYALISCGDNEVALWNIDSGKLEQLFKVLPSTVSENTAMSSPSLEAVDLPSKSNDWFSYGFLNDGDGVNCAVSNKAIRATLIPTSATGKCKLTYY